MPAYRSTSQRRKYRECGYQYFLHYDQGWRPQREKGRFEFGRVMHTLAEEIVKGLHTSADAGEDRFRELWQAVKPEQYAWTAKNPHRFFEARGVGLARLMTIELPKVFPAGSAEVMTEETIDYEITTGTTPERAIIDYYGPANFESVTGDDHQVLVPSGRGVVDFKTSDRRYDPRAGEIDEQLTDYQLAEQWGRTRRVDFVGYCVLVYTSVPVLQWLIYPARSQELVNHFVRTAVQMDRGIRAELFVQNDRACFAMGECPMVSLCYPSQRGQRDAMLKQVKATDSVSDEASELI